MIAKIIVNAITCLRFPLAVIVPLAMWGHRFEIAAPCYLLGMASDWIDGMLARRLKAETEFGAKRLEPAADTFFLLGGLIGLVLIKIIPWWLLVIIIIIDQIIQHLVKPRVPRPDRILFIQTVFLQSTVMAIFLYLLFMTLPELVLAAIIFIPVIIYLKRERIKHFARWCFRKD